MGGEFSARVNIKTPGTLEEPGVIAGTFFIVSVFAFHRLGGKTERISTPPYNSD